ncbi:hypothetical protein [Aquimonas voraii]|uniref:Uncharacterized protein n=1 Tax=Aquimonas voraii TaxID=265719 RepID=A0A1G6SSW2_9GAMM|nr:hypothetical protein [Aquimonas voraii]SDD19869.1 hypothetical protein SAMN04488509_101672 [Aquimonas voraii]
MNTFRTLASSCALLLAGALSTSAQAASSNDYYIHFVGNDFIQSDQVTLNSQWNNPIAPKAGACGIRLLGSENTQWVDQYGFHFGTANISTQDPIVIRLRDLPGCSGSGIDISVDGVPVAWPNQGFESFFVYQADNFRWVDNNGNVIPNPGCGAACLGPGRIKAASQNAGWNSAIFVLENASLAGQRDGGSPLDARSIQKQLRLLQPSLALAELERTLLDAVELRRREMAGSEDRDLRDREDVALTAIAESAQYAQRCELAWSRGSSDASTLCERAARLGEQARAAVDVAIDLLPE